MLSNWSSSSRLCRCNTANILHVGLLYTLWDNGYSNFELLSSGISRGLADPEFLGRSLTSLTDIRLSFVLAILRDCFSAFFCHLHSSLVLPVFYPAVTSTPPATNDTTRFYFFFCTVKAWSQLFLALVLAPVMVKVNNIIISLRFWRNRKRDDALSDCEKRAEEELRRRFMSQQAVAVDDVYLFLG